MHEREAGSFAFVSSPGPAHGLRLVHGEARDQMLILTRKLGESVIIGDQQIRITVTEIKGKQVKLAIDAPREVVVCREEIYEKFMRRHDPPAV